MKKINYTDLIDIEKKIKHPFSREITVAKVKRKYGKGSIIKYDLGNGLAIFARNFTVNEDIILTEESDISGACFIFNLGNNISFFYKDRREFILRKNHFFIELASDKFYCEVPLKKDEPFLSYFVGIKDDLFLKLAYEINDIDKYMKEAVKQSYYILEELEIDTLQNELFNIFKNKEYFEDILKSMYLESKTINLLHYSIEKTAKILNKKTTANFDENRLSSLERAKEIIMTEYNKNLSIKEISYRSAINQCYLKKDFKEYYGLTIFEMIQQRRLKIAKQLLQKDICVKDVSYKVGYKHVGNFSKIFQRNFGISPSKYKKTIHTQNR